MKKTILPLLLLVIGIFSASAQFSGDFAPYKWTFNTTTFSGDGSVDTSGAPGTIVLHGSDNGGMGGYEEFTIPITQTGIIGFDYNHYNDDIDDAYYTINGSETQITSSGSGRQCVTVTAGDIFGLRVQNYDNCCGRGILTVTNFVFSVGHLVAITQHPVSQSICESGNTTFTVTATGACLYQWQVDTGSGFADITSSPIYSGETTGTLTITGATAAMHGNLYRCVVEGSTNSNSAMLTIHTAPSLTVTPADTTVSGGNPVVLTVTGADTVGRAISFDGTNDYLEIPDHADLRPNTGITLSAWVNPTASTGTWGFIFGKEVPAVAQDYLLSVSNTNQIHGRFMMDGGYWSSFYTTTTIPYGQWTHLALTYDNTTIKLYINGALNYTETVSLPLDMSSSATLNIGRRSDGQLYFNGKIDEASIWNRALTQTEISQLIYLNATAAGSGLAAYWKMNEGTGTTTADASGNGHTATLKNGATWNNPLAHYQWSPATDLSGTSGNSVTATISATRTYTASYTSYTGCSSSAQADVNLSVGPPIWNGTSNWTDNPHWTNGSPDSADSAVVATGTLTVNTNVEVDDLTLQNGTSVVVAAGKTLTVKGDLINNGGTFEVAPTGSMIFERELKKGTATRMKTFGKIKVMSGTLQLRN